MIQVLFVRKVMTGPAVLFFLIFALLTVVSVSAQDSYEDFVKQDTQSYEDFERQEKEAFEKYKEEVMKKWNEFNNSTKRDWYEYSEDLNAMSKVDFKDGEVTIETVVPKESQDVEAAARENIRRQIRGLFETDSTTHEKILENQVILDSGEKVTGQNADKFIRDKVLPQVKVNGTQTTFKSKDGVERVKVKVSFKLIPDHLKVRAEKYLDLVKEYSHQYNLEASLVLAVIQTESYFNPRAKSGAPAYGLMQLVPKSGGRDAYRYVFKEDKIVKPNYLYIPKNNILLGCAYLAKMRDNEFKRVSDEDSKRFCMVASYNTGPGNLSKAITGNSKLTKAIDKINKMSSEELYARLIRKLPYEETRDYLQKVESRREKYISWQ